ncbi:hypothetical protein LguiA_008739 [Lonicera macranthoides]
MGEARSDNDPLKVSKNGECQPEVAGKMDVIIVGAIVAGSALACTLAKDVGELLQPGGYLKLIELGLQDCVNEIDAQRVYGYTLFKDGKSTRLSYPLKKFGKSWRAEAFTTGVSYRGRMRRLQHLPSTLSLLYVCEARTRKVTSLVENKGTFKGVHYKTGTGEEMTVYAPLTTVDIPSCFVALLLKIELIALIKISCLVDIPGEKVPSICNGDMAHYLNTVIAPQRVASTINTLAGALSKVFCSSTDKARNELGQACFDYLSLGGNFSNGPVALLSGLNPKPLSLVLHLFSVAIYGVGRLLLPFPSPKRAWLGARLIFVTNSNFLVSLVMLSLAKRWRFHEF